MALGIIREARGDSVFAPFLAVWKYCILLETAPFLAEASVIGLSQILSIDMPTNYSSICFTLRNIGEL
jgi:hypothetical protein